MVMRQAVEIRAAEVFCGTLIRIHAPATSRLDCSKA